jgi:hypothetical protein
MPARSCRAMSAELQADQPNTKAVNNLAHTLGAGDAC